MISTTAPSQRRIRPPRALPPGAAWGNALSARVITIHSIHGLDSFLDLIQAILDRTGRASIHVGTNYLDHRFFEDFANARFTQR